MNTKLIDLHCDSIHRCAEEGLTLTSDAMHFNIDKRPGSLRICQAMAIFDNKLRGKSAQAHFLKAYDAFVREVNAHGERLSALRDLRYISQGLDEKPVAVFLSVEGGGVLAGDILWVDKLHELGVKMMTLTWNGENELCGGVGSDIGFTPFGREVVARMESLGMAVDVSHLNDTGFWELCEFAGQPFCASHSNSRSVCPHPRNLTDDQFREIVRRGGVVGLNYYRNFIADGGETYAIDDLLRHLHHFLELGGQDTVALGSDFDGADMPDYLSGVQALPLLIDALERSGIGGDVVDKLLFGNASRYLSSLEKERDDR